MSHLGRPQGRDESQSLKPVAERMGVEFASDCVGPTAEEAVGRLRDGQVLLLENLRFHPEEEADDQGFAKQLAALGDLYVNDAFAAAHRAHASVVGVARLLPAYAGALMLAELEALHRALDEPQRPLVAIVGGAKVSTKSGVVRSLLPRVDTLIVVGAMANTFFKARGAEVGASLVEDASLDDARAVDREAGEKLVLPVDSVCASKPEAGQETRVLGVDQIPAGWMRSEEHTSELQSRVDLVCRLLLEKTNDQFSASLLCVVCLLLLMMLRPPSWTLFPYTTLFRSR